MEEDPKNRDRNAKIKKSLMESYAVLALVAGTILYALTMFAFMTVGIVMAN